ncbi:MAG: hypothetical protein ABL963_15190 [Longimicrobiales bacterium]
MKRALLASVLVAVALGRPTSVAAYTLYQETPPARLIAFTNEPREPDFGEVFELYLSLRFAPNVVAFVPDTLLPDVHAFSAGAGSWVASPGPFDSIDVQATYPVMGLLTGGVQLPWLEILSRPAASGETPGPHPASELDELGDTARVGLRRTVLEIGGALILVPKEMQGEEASIDPRPPADVLGGEWSSWLLGALAVAVGAALLLAGMFVATRRAQARAGNLAAAANPREEALAELDRLLGLGWHANGRLAEFYDATTGVLRQLSEVEEPEWRRALTSSELVHRMQERWGVERVEGLRPAITTAERVKFGTHRPGSGAAEADWSRVRDWIRALPEA